MAGVAAVAVKNTGTKGVGSWRLPRAERAPGWQARTPLRAVAKQVCPTRRRSSNGARGSHPFGPQPAANRQYFNGSHGGACPRARWWAARAWAWRRRRPHHRSGAWSRSGLGGRMRGLSRRRSSGTVSAMSCSVPAPEPLLDQLADDVHAPGAARARPVPLSHPPPAAGGGRRPCSAARHRARRIAAGARPGRPRGGTRPAGGPRRAKRKSRCGRAPCPRLAAGVHHHVAADTRQGPAPAHRGPGGPPGSCGSLAPPGR
jgi:hypothetical protein